MGLPVLLLLNKADLVPPAAAAAWAAWFEARHPGLRALPVSAAPGAAAASQRAVLAALLALRVRRGGREVAASELVGLSLGGRRGGAP
jgi:ribosome biogenesis GTPase A